MGRAPRSSPARLPAKLLRIREVLGLSQNGMVRALGMTDDLLREEVSDFERGRRPAPLAVVLAYARAVGVPVELLIDDARELPLQMPTGVPPEWIDRWNEIVVRLYTRAESLNTDEDAVSSPLRRDDQEP